MKRKEIEKLLKSEIENNTPFVLPNALRANVTPEIVREKAKSKKHEKPYFRFRYLYVSLCMFAVLVVGLGIFLPNINQNYIADHNQTQTEDYIIVSTIYVDDYRAEVTSNKDNTLSSVKIYQNTTTLQNVDLSALQTITQAYSYVITYFDDLNLFDGVSQIQFSVNSTNSTSVSANYDSMKISLLSALAENDLNLTIVQR